MCAPTSTELYMCAMLPPPSTEVYKCATGQPLPSTSFFCKEEVEDHDSFVSYHSNRWFNSPSQLPRSNLGTPPLLSSPWLSPTSVPCSPSYRGVHVCPYFYRAAHVCHAPPSFYRGVQVCYGIAPPTYLFFLQRRGRGPRQLCELP